MNDVMDALATATGGEFVHNSNDLSSAMRRMATEPETRYVLGFSPAELRPDGKFHVLKVKLTRPARSTAEARRGYFDPNKPPAAAPPDEQQLVDDALLRGRPTATLAAVTTAGIRHKGDAELAELFVKVHVTVNDFPFVKRQDRNVDYLVFVSALFDDHGNFVSGKQGWMELALRDSTLEQFRKSGITGDLTLPVRPGVYRLREVVQEVADRRISISDRTIEVR